MCVAFENLLGDLNLEPLKTILRALETMFQTAPMEQWALALDGSLAMVKLVKYATGTVSFFSLLHDLCSLPFNCRLTTRSFLGERASRDEV